ncbi:MAG: hypothetical protein U0230_05410 [Polyangiales bacterium]
MRLGIVGPASGNVDAFREAAEFLLGDAACDQLVYLGVDDVVDRIAQAWLSELGGGAGKSFEDRAVELALGGSPAAIEGLLEADVQVARLERIRKIPKPPARAVELLDDRIVVLVHDKAVLDEEDIANSHLLVYGQSKEMLLRKFGPRAFFSPGPLESGRVGVVEIEDEGRVTVSVFDLEGTPILRETLGQRSAKLTVAS